MIASENQSRLVRFAEHKSNQLKMFLQPYLELSFLYNGSGISKTYKKYSQIYILITLFYMIISRNKLRIEAEAEEKWWTDHISVCMNFLNF